MNNKKHILISLDMRHAENIFSQNKHVELRRRNMNIDPGTIAWIYVKLPVGSIVGKVCIDSVHSASPTALWRDFGHVSGLTKNEFFDYYKGVRTGIALVLKDAEMLEKSLTLSAIRDIAHGFQPPQFFSRLHEKHPLLRAVCI